MVLSESNDPAKSAAPASLVAATAAQQNGASGNSGPPAANGSASVADAKSLAGQLAALQQLMAQLDALTDSPPPKSK